MSEAKAILTIDVEYPLGGVPTLTRTIYDLMEGWGYRPIVYRAEIGLTLTRRERLKKVIRYFGLREEEENGMHLRIAPPLGLPLWLFYLAPHLLVNREIAEQSPVFVTSGSAHVGLPLALRGIPYILWIATLYEDEVRAKAQMGDEWAQQTLASPTWGLLKLQERFAIRHAYRILALSSHTAQRLLEVYPEAASRLETVLYPIDVTRFCPNPQARKASPYGCFLLLAARINDRRKNVPLLLKAFKLVRERFPELRLVLTGEPPSQSLLDLTNELGLADSVVFRGIVSPDELLALYQAAQLFVLPSAQEGLGIVTLEAMACGTPVVTTASGGPEGLVINGVTGAIVQDLHDSDELARAIIGSLENPDKMEVTRQNCVKLAHEQYASPIVAARLYDAFTSTLDAAQAPSRWRMALAATWVILVLAAYLQRQLTLHWPSIQMRVLDPLLSWLP